LADDDRGADALGTDVRREAPAFDERERGH
jgi:hypothetical protein